MTQNAINNTASIVDVDNLRLDGNVLSSTDTNGNVTLFPDGSGEVSVTTAPIVPTGDRADSLGSATNSWDNVYADGVSFNDGTNIIAFYVASTWTPVVEFGGASVGITYTTQSANYIRIGDLVYISFTIVLSSKGSSTGNAKISGLPITSSTDIQPMCAMGCGQVTLASSRTWVTCRADGNNTTLNISQCGAAGQSLTTLKDSECANDTELTGGGFYFL